jgi:hypothetical protein
MTSWAFLEKEAFWQEVYRDNQNGIEAAIFEVIPNEPMSTFGRRGVWCGEVIWSPEQCIGEQNKLDSETFSRLAT